MSFLKRCIELLWKRCFPPAKTYGVSTDDTIVLEDIPRKYPVVENKYNTENGTKHYVVVDICKNDGRVTFSDDKFKEFFEVHIEVFEELFVSVDPKENYPL